MANYLVTDTELTSVANAIRTKGGTESLLEFPSEFVSAIAAIPTGGSSDFSTAEVTITLRPPESSAYSGVFKAAQIVEGNTIGESSYDSEVSTTCSLSVIVPSGGYAVLTMGTANDVMFDSITGNAEQDGDFTLLISGDCSADVVDYEE